MHAWLEFFYGFLIGAIIISCAYTLALFFRNKSVELILYSCYALSMGFYIFYRTHLELFHINTVSYSVSFFSELSQIGGHLLYNLFLIYFLETKLHIPKLHKLLKICIGLIIAYLIILFIITFIFKDIELAEYLRLAIRVFLLIYSSVLLFMGFINWGPLMKYMFWGGVLMYIFSIMATISMITWKQNNLNTLNSLEWFSIGILSELFFFILGLTYKNEQKIKKLHDEKLLLLNEKLKYEHSYEINRLQVLTQERYRIAQDLHDDIGASLSGIALLSNITSKKLEKGDVSFTKDSLIKIQQYSQVMIAELKDLVWSMKNNNISNNDIIQRIINNAKENCEYSNVLFKYEIETKFYNLQLSMLQKHHLQLISKEAINNALKYSKATDINFIIKSCVSHYECIIQDNGIGFDLNFIKGNGLTNMEKRAKEIGDNFDIKSNNEGTKITWNIKIP